MPYPNYYPRTRYPLDGLRRAAPDDPNAIPDDEDEMQGPGDLSALLARPDPEMDAKWRQAEDLALRKSQQGTTYGVAEGVRDFAPMGIGALLDILVNKGKGLGVLAAGGMQAIGQEQSRRDAAQKAAAAQALAIRQQRESGADRAIQAQHAMLRSAELEQRMAEFRRLHPDMTPEEAKAAALADINEKKAHTNLLEAQAHEKWTYPGLDPLLNVARFQETVMQHGLQNDRADADAADRKKDREDRDADRKQAQHDRKSDLFSKRTEKVIPLAQTMRRADEVISRLTATNPNADLPGHGQTGWVPFSWLSEDGKAIRLAVDQMTEQVARGWSGANIPKHERVNIEKAVKPGTSDKDLRIGLASWNRYVKGQIRRHGVAAGDDVTREALEATEPGLYDYVYDRAAPKEKTGPSMVSPNAPDRVRGPQNQTVPQPAPAPPPQGAQPSAAAPQQQPGQDWQGLWEKVPAEQRAAVGQRLQALPEDQRYEALRKLASGIPLEPGSVPSQPQPEPSRPPGRGARPTPPAAAPTPPAGPQPEPEHAAAPKDLRSMSDEDIQKNMGSNPDYALEWARRLNEQFETSRKIHELPDDQLDLSNPAHLKEYDWRQRRGKKLPGTKGGPRAPTAGEPTDADLKQMDEDELDPKNPRHARELRRRAQEREKAVGSKYQGVRPAGR